MKRTGFLVVVLLWTAIPLAHTGVAQDAVPFGVAGALVGTHPESIYIPADATSAHQVTERFRAGSCAHYPSVGECADSVVAFVSTPLALPLVVPLGWLGHHVSLAMRLLGVAALVAAMAIVWRSLAGTDDLAPACLLLSAALLTPLVAFTLDVGQNTPLLFLAATLPIASVDKGWRRVAVAVLLVVTIALKVWPVALVGVLVLQRRHRLLACVAVAAGGLALAASALAPVSLWGSFLAANHATTTGTAQLWNNGSLDAALSHLGVPSPAVTPLAWLVRAALVAPVARIYRSAPDDNVRWSFTWLAALLFFPQVWGHYLVVGFAATAAAVAAHPRPGRWLWAVPASAAVVGVAGGLATGGAPVAQFVGLALLVALVAGVVLSGRRPDGDGGTVNRATGSPSRVAPGPRA